MNLGVVLHAQSKLADAGAEYDEAIRLAPTLAGAHHNRGNVWMDVGALAPGIVRDAMLAQACSEYARANKLAPADPDEMGAMKKVDALMQGSGHCPPD